jgi:hypothetical protein
MTNNNRYSRLIDDINLITSRYIGLENNKANQSKLNSDMKLTLNFYKLLLADVITNESVSASLLEDGNIQLKFSPVIQEWYNKR